MISGYKSKKCMEMCSGFTRIRYAISINNIITHSLKDKNMPNGEEKNWIRLCGAIDGFRSRYKNWPTRIRLGSSYLNDIRSILKPDDYIKLQNRLDIVVDNVHIIAEDDSGRKYDYEKEGFAETKPDVKAKDWLGIRSDSID